MVEIKMPVEYMIEGAVSDDETRGAIQRVLVTDTGGTWAVATTGHVLAVVPVQVAGLLPPHGLLLHRATIVEARKAAKKARLTELAIVRTGAGDRLIDGRIMPIPPEDAALYPAWLQVATQVNDTKGNIVGLNPEYLLDVARAIGWYPKCARGIQITLGGKLDPIRVTLGGKSGLRDPYGLVMPMRV